MTRNFMTFRLPCIIQGLLQGRMSGSFSIAEWSGNLAPFKLLARYRFSLIILGQLLMFVIPATSLALYLSNSMLCRTQLSIFGWNTAACLWAEQCFDAFRISLIFAVPLLFLYRYRHLSRFSENIQTRLLPLLRELEKKLGKSTLVTLNVDLRDATDQRNLVTQQVVHEHLE